jgi:hypothetical protein
VDAPSAGGIAAIIASTLTYCRLPEFCNWEKQSRTNRSSGAI